jgi:hypothetical protein
MELKLLESILTIKKKSIFAPILMKLHFSKLLILEMDWLAKGVGTILSQKDEKKECVIIYSSKRLSLIQNWFHPMEGEFYALIWGIMHFCQFFCHNHFTLKIDHKPLEWLTTMFDGYGKKGNG